jgi:hypothetical protein
MCGYTTNVEYEMYYCTILYYNIILIIISGATGTVRKDLRKYLESIPGKHSIDSLQRIAILGTSDIIRKVLQSETLKPEWWGSPLFQEEKSLRKGP